MQLSAQKQFSLSYRDVSFLMRNRSADIKINVLEKISDNYNRDLFKGEQQHIAEEIFRLLVNDLDEAVRVALSEGLKNSSRLPKDIVLSLAEDVEKVATPMLQFSPLLEDEDLIRIILNSGTEKHVAIAHRSHLSEALSLALIQTKNDVIAGYVLKHPNAVIGEKAGNEIIEVFGRYEHIIQLLLSHDCMNPALATRIVDRIGKYIKEWNDHNQHQTPRLKNASRGDGVDTPHMTSIEMTALGLITKHKEFVEFIELQQLVNSLKKGNDLTLELFVKNSKLTSMLRSMERYGKLRPLTALCVGDTTLFYVMMAYLCNISTFNAKKLIEDPEGWGIFKLCKQAGIAEPLCPVIKLLHNAARTVEKKHKNAHFSERASAILDILQKENLEEEVPYFSYVQAAVKTFTYTVY